MNKIDRRIAVKSIAASLVGAPFISQRSYASQQPLKIVVVVPAGASMDSVARIVAGKLPPFINREVVVEYKPGGVGLVAASFMKTTPTDGSYLLFAPTATVSFFPFLYSSLPYDPDNDLTPVSEGVSGTYGFATSNSTSVDGLKQYLEAAKRDAKIANVGTSSLAGVGSFMIFQLRKLSGVELSLVAYKGGQPLHTDLLGNHVAAGISVLSDYLESHRAKLLRVIAVSSKTRSKLAPDIPTFTEAGFPDLDGQVSIGFFVKGGTPKPLINQYSEAITKIMKMPDVEEKISQLGLKTTGGSPEQYVQIIRDARKKWEPVARESGIKFN